MNIYTRANITDSGILILLGRPDCTIGDEKWWNTIQQEGTPLILDTESDICDVIFVWKGNNNRDKTNKNNNIHIRINGITNHHSFDITKLTNITGTNVWFYHALIEKTLRCSYALIPLRTHLAQPRYQGSTADKNNLYRQWLRKIFQLSICDPLNQHLLSNCTWAETHSLLHMPNSIPQKSWEEFDMSTDISINNHSVSSVWKSEILGNTRNIWIYSTSHSATKETLPLVLLFDGRFWAESMPLYDALANATECGVLPAANYVLIDEIDGQQRNKDLSCNPDFWQAINNELLPLLSTKVTIHPNPEQTVLVGQSLGGLSATYGALHWPEVFGGAVCQSSSFWWPDLSLIKSPSEYTPTSSTCMSVMSQHIHHGLGREAKLNLFLEVGSREDFMIDLNYDVYQQLASQNHNIHYRMFDGGHDRACWRGGIIDGLSFVLQNNH